VRRHGPRVGINLHRQGLACAVEKPFIPQRARVVVARLGERLRRQRAQRFGVSAQGINHASAQFWAALSASTRFGVGPVIRPMRTVRTSRPARVFRAFGLLKSKRHLLTGDPIGAE